jgi:hypothetical protein
MWKNWPKPEEERITGLMVRPCQIQLKPRYLIHSQGGKSLMLLNKGKEIMPKTGHRHSVLDVVNYTMHVTKDITQSVGILMNNKSQHL